MASSVATPLERQFGRIAGVTEMTSTSYARLDAASRCSSISSRNIDGAARDVQAAINAARGQLPANLPNNPDLPQGQSGRRADHDPGAHLGHRRAGARCTTPRRRILQQKLSQVEGVGQVIVGGSSLPAVRVELNPTALNKLRHRRSRTCARRSPRTNANRPEGPARRTATRTWQIDDQRSALKAARVPAADRRLPQRRARCGSATSATVDGLGRGPAHGGLANGKPAVLLIIFRQPGANIIETVDRVRALLPQLQASIPRSDRPRRWCMDRTPTIRASLHDVERDAADLGRARDPGGVRVPARACAPRSSRASRCRSRSSARSASCTCSATASTTCR